MATTAAPISAAEIQKKWHTDFDSPNYELLEKEGALLTVETYNAAAGEGGGGEGRRGSITTDLVFLTSDSASGAATSYELKHNDTNTR